MPRNSYTSSERRGIIAIGVIALVIMAAGLILSFCRRESEQEKIVVTEYPQFVDSVSLKNKNSVVTRSKKKTKKERADKKKTYRRRSPLDEPVSE